MSSPCTARRTALTRTGALAVVFGLTLAPTASVLAQDAQGFSTVRALLGGDGSVSSIERLGGGDLAGQDVAGLILPREDRDAELVGDRAAQAAAGGTGAGLGRTVIGIAHHA